MCPSCSIGAARLNKVTLDMRHMSPENTTATHPTRRHGHDQRGSHDAGLHDNHHYHHWSLACHMTQSLEQARRGKSFGTSKARATTSGEVLNSGRTIINTPERGCRSWMVQPVAEASPVLICVHR